MKIAVVGAGIAGLCCAYLLHERHEVTVFEGADYLGGHTNTSRIVHEGRSLDVDTGFIVFNEKTYPKFCELLVRLGVASKPSRMSFSVRDDAHGIEYGGHTPLGLFAKPRNLARPAYLRVLRDIFRLGLEGSALLAATPAGMTVREWCVWSGFSREFCDFFLKPMAGAVWSAPRAALDGYPARFVLGFFENHGMLDVRRALAWRVIEGGSRTYVRAMTRGFADRTRVSCAVSGVRREASRVMVEHRHGCGVFDHVILATHPDQALAVLEDASGAEREVLGAMPFHPNRAVLHTDASALPQCKHAWAAWNFRALRDACAPAVVTYNMSMLQSLGTRTPVCVTLNAPEDGTGSIDPSRVLGVYDYHHPQYTLAGVRARARWREVSGAPRRTHYCGAYWFHGFHEDGVRSALRVCNDFGVSL